MNLRQIIAAIMILLSLSAPARAAFACAMMPGDALAACCCEDGKDRCPQGTASATCCDQIIPADAPFAHSALRANGKQFAHPPAGQLALGPAPHLLPAAFDTGDRLPRVHRRSVPLQHSPALYLLTARLRL